MTKRRGLKDAAQDPMVGSMPLPARSTAKWSVGVIKQILIATLTVAVGFVGGVVLTRRFKIF
ncbi:MAG: hypothetical protein PVG81_10115 [Desulfobacterales bacterium]|jgi:hypothetical protein